MPTLRRTPFNQGGSYVSDPFDQAESENRNAALQAYQINDNRAQNDRMTQLALAKLNGDMYMFGQGRADNMSMFRESQASADRRMQAEFDFNTKRWGVEDAKDQRRDERDAARDAESTRRYDQLWKYNTDPNVNPALADRRRIDAIEADLGAYKLEKMKKDEERRDAAGAGPGVTPKFEDDAEREAHNVDIADGLSPAAAAQRLRERRDAKVKGAVDARVSNLKAKFRDYHRRDTTAAPSILGGETDPDDTEAQVLESLANGLAQEMAEKQRIPLGQAQAVIAEQLRGAAPRGGMTADATELLYKRLGWL